MRIGFFGGSFNPPTIAHKALADFAFESCGLDRLMWIVSPHNPEKDIKTLAPFADRLAMVEQVLAYRPQMSPSDIEQNLGTSYTIHTVRKLRQKYPDDTLIWFMGTDNWEGFHLWGTDYEKILHNVSIVVLERPGYSNVETCLSSATFSDQHVTSPQDLKPFNSWTVLSNELMDVAATEVRKAAGLGIKHEHITDETWAYIVEHGLYGTK